MVVVALNDTRVGRYGDFFFYSKGVEVDDGDGGAVVGGVQTTGVGHVEFAVADAETFGIAAAVYGAIHFQAGGVDADNVAVEAADICLAGVESDLARLLAAEVDGAQVLSL